jgi:ABC-type lipoprotein export system ATPase subunit
MNELLKFFCIVIFLFFVVSNLIASGEELQDDLLCALSKDDMEIIQNLRLLENLEVLQNLTIEDFDLLENLEAIENIKESEESIDQENKNE